MLPTYSIFCKWKLQNIVIFIWNFNSLGWHAGMNVSSDIYWIYVTEAGFYFHGIYGTIFMDIWRDDSMMLLLHHVLTISLIVFSLGLR